MSVSLTADNMIDNSLSDNMKSSGGFGSRLWGRIKSASQSLRKVASIEVNTENTRIGLQNLNSATQSVGRSLLKKSIDTVNTVRNSSSEDKAWFLANMGVGLGAKALLLSGVATGGTSLLVAAAGGIISGATRTILDRARAHRDGDTAKLSQSFSRQFLLNTVSGGVISTATLGILGSFTYLTKIDLSDIFSRASEKALDSSDYVSMPPVTEPEVNQLRQISELSEPKSDIQPVPVPVPEAVVPQAMVPNVPAPKPIEKILGVRVSPAVPVSTDVLASSGLSPSDTLVPDTQDNPAVVALEVQDPVSIPPVSPVEVKLPDGTVKAIQMPPRPDIKAEWKVAFNKVHGLEVNRLVRMDYETQFGTAAPGDLTAAELAALINPENSTEYIDDISKRAEVSTMETLPPNKIRGACLTDLPASEEAHQARGRILTNICSVDSDAPLQEGEYVTIRDVGEPISKPEKRGIWSGIRAIFAGAQTPANEFMGEAIGRIEINQMASDKLAANPR